MSSRRRDSERDEDYVVGDNTRLIEWTTEIYGVFWGIWIGFSVQQIVTGCETPLNDYKWAGLWLPYLPLGLSVGLSILASVYTFFLIKWLWGMRFIQPHEAYPSVFAKLGKVARFWILVVAAMVLVHVFCHVGWHWIWMGVWSTLGWIATVSALVLIDTRSWQ